MAISETIRVGIASTFTPVKFAHENFKWRACEHKGFYIVVDSAQVCTVKTPDLQKNVKVVVLVWKWLYCKWFGLLSSIFYDSDTINVKFTALQMKCRDDGFTVQTVPQPPVNAMHQRDIIHYTKDICAVAWWHSTQYWVHRASNYPSTAHMFNTQLFSCHSATPSNLFTCVSVHHAP